MASLRYKFKHLLLVCLITFAALSINYSDAAEPKRVALLPFKINAEKDMSFLQNGIYDMLTTRLSKDDEVVVIGRQEVENTITAMGSPDVADESLARKIGSRLNADYTLFGSLTVLGNSISLDAKMVDVTNNTPSTSFSEQSQDLGGIITKVNQIAAEINTKIFNRQPDVAQKTAAPAPEVTKTEPPKDETHMHPEKLLSRGAEGEGSPFIMETDKEEKGGFQKFWRSASFKQLINGIALGDVDKDGKIETVVVTPHTVVFYRSEQGKFYKVHETEEDSSRYHIGVDIADINGNGYPEIFITALNVLLNELDSCVFEYDGQTFNKIVDNSRWYYRVASVPHRGNILFGQRPSSYSLSYGKIYDMIWQNGDYVPEEEVKVPRKTNLMGFALGDVSGEASQTAVAYKENDHIQLIDSSGKEMWQSSESYGGSSLYWAAAWTDQGQQLNPKYYPMRLIVRDEKADETAHVIAVKNYDWMGGKLDYRRLIASHIESLAWDGVGLSTVWRTRKMTGFIRDYAIGDFDNDGIVELVAALIIEEGRIITSVPKSTIIAYELPS